MRRLPQWQAVRLLLLVAFLGGAGASLWEDTSKEDIAEVQTARTWASERPHPLSDLPGPLEGVHASVRFLSGGSNSEMYAGKDVHTMLNLFNSRESPITVSTIAGSVNARNEFSKHMHNFSAVHFRDGASIQPGSQQELSYTFTPSINLKPSSYQVAITAFYTPDSVNEYSTTAFNATVAVLEDNGSFDLANVFIVLVLTSCALAVAYFAVERHLTRKGKTTLAKRLALVDKERKKRKADAAAAAATTGRPGSSRSADEAQEQPSSTKDPDFLAGTSIEFEQKRREKGGSSSRQKKKSTKRNADKK